ncbi:MAG: formylglycine-generating enzyme family protein [Campylobacterota bacterium]|nr:formylglycine-generating enzyme family protein [Campylobacterota bacterium]
MKNLLLLIATTLLLNAQSYTNSIGMEFVKIPSGSFMMGRDANFEDGSSDELPQHRESVSSFYMQTTEVTQAQWVRVMGYNPSNFKGRNNPVEKVSWYDAKKFIKKLNAMEGSSKYYLPSETQWEYAARAGSSSAYCFGDDKGGLGAYAWYNANSGERTHPVAQKRANKWGLYDMHGNVWEWTSSCYTENYNRGCYKSSDGNSYKVLRGGSWLNDAYDTRSADRDDCSPTDRYYFYGFRVARTLD